MKLAGRASVSMLQRMSTVGDIEKAILNLTPEELQEFTVWFEDQQQLLASSGSLFRMYDEEEEACRARVAEKSG